MIKENYYIQPIDYALAMDIVKKALSLPSLSLEGLHCHIGSQIFDIEPFSDAASIMIRFIAKIKTELGYEIRELNLGGGLGVRYTEYDRTVDYASAIKDIASLATSK